MRWEMEKPTVRLMKIKKKSQQRKSTTFKLLNQDLKFISTYLYEENKILIFF